MADNFVVAAAVSSRNNTARHNTDPRKAVGNKRDKQEQQRQRQSAAAYNRNPLPGPTAPKRAAPAQSPAEQQGNKLVSQLSVQHPPSRLRTKRRPRDDKPTALMRAWVRVDPQGGSSIVHADKLTLTQQLGIQPRDLRLLESQVANQTSVILCRERAIVINMAFVKTIITLDACYIVSPDDERAIQFMAELKNRLQEPLACSKSVGKLTGGVAPEWAKQALELPFELRCLEICLDELANDLDERAKQLEAAAYPAVDAMAKLSNRPNLDRVRRVKNALIQLYKTTETFHEALEELLDNDKDMWEMNLGAKDAARQMAVEEATGVGGGAGRDVSDAQHTQLAPVAEDEVLAMAPLPMSPLPEEPHFSNYDHRGDVEGGGGMHQGHDSGEEISHMESPSLWHQDPVEGFGGEQRQQEQFETIHEDALEDGGYGSYGGYDGGGSDAPGSHDGTVVSVEDSDRPGHGLMRAMYQHRGGWGASPLGRQAGRVDRDRDMGVDGAGGTVTDEDMVEHTDAGTDADVGAGTGTGGGMRSGSGSESGTSTQLPLPPSASGTPRGDPDGMPSMSTIPGVAGGTEVDRGTCPVPDTAPAARPVSPPLPPHRCSLNNAPTAPRWSPFAAACHSSEFFEPHPFPGAPVYQGWAPGHGPAGGSPPVRGGSGGLSGGSPPPRGGSGGEVPFPGWYHQPQSTGQYRGSLDGGMMNSPGRTGTPYERPFNALSQHPSASLARLSRHSLALLSARHGSSLASSSALSSVYDMEVTEVERLLEAYFMHVNSVHRRLKTLSEYIEDTEEMVYSSLNAKRNRLLAYDLCFIGINTISMTVTAVTGLFTMNLFHPESDSYMQTPSTFLEIAFAGLGAYLLFGGLLAYYMHTGVVRFT